MTGGRGRDLQCGAPGFLGEARGILCVHAVQQPLPRPRRAGRDMVPSCRPAGRRPGGACRPGRNRSAPIRLQCRRGRVTSDRLAAPKKTPLPLPFPAPRRAGACRRPWPSPSIGSAPEPGCANWREAPGEVWVAGLCGDRPEESARAPAGVQRRCPEGCQLQRRYLSLKSRGRGGEPLHVAARCFAGQGQERLRTRGNAPRNGGGRPPRRLWRGSNRPRKAQHSPRLRIADGFLKSPGRLLSGGP